MLALDVPDTEKPCLKKTFYGASNLGRGDGKKYEMGEKYIYILMLLHSLTLILLDNYNAGFSSLSKSLE